MAAVYLAKAALRKIFFRISAKKNDSMHSSMHRTSSNMQDNGAEPARQAGAA
jgi:hypothetical protein